MKALRPVLLPVVAVTAVCAIVSAVFEGWDGLLGASLGGAVVALFLGSTPLVLSPLVKAGAALSMPAALGFFTTKAVAMLVVLLLLFDVGGIGDRVHDMSFGLTAIVVSLVWTALQVRAFQRSRIPTYDLGDEG